MIMYKTGDQCPLCGQPIKLRSRMDLFALSVICHFTGLNDVARTEEALKRAEEERQKRLKGRHSL